MALAPLTLFIIKKFYDYDGNYLVSNGLRTSAELVVQALLLQRVRAKLVSAIDGNCIDRLVTEEKPTTVIIEALWVTPAKLKELKGLHPTVKFVVRIHSELAFLANEGICIEWIGQYLADGVDVAFNSKVTTQDIALTLAGRVDPDFHGQVHYLPNCYPVRRYVPRPAPPAEDIVHVGCFGAVRPLKNQLVQAFAAVQYARAKRQKLVFHMNGSRPEQGGENNVKAIAGLLAATGDVLVLHPWLEHEDFLNLLTEMDICLQVSLSESFNIVSADAVSMSVPLVGSNAIRWLPPESQADANNSFDIAHRMNSAHVMTATNHDALAQYMAHSLYAWGAFLGVDVVVPDSGQTTHGGFLAALKLKLQLLLLPVFVIIFHVLTR